MNIYKEGTKQGVRFNLKGILTIEDLWTLKLEDLNSIAIGLNKLVKESEEESFIKEKTTASKELILKLEIVKDIISTKMDEKKAKELKALKASKVAKIQALIDQKAEEGMAAKSIEELTAELKALEAE